MDLKKRIRRIARRAGIDIVPYPLANPMARTVKLLQHYSVGCVVDVGANDGGFATALRDLGYRGRIISFEPLSGPFRVLQSRAASDDDWEVNRLAIGDSEELVTINVSNNRGLSSSVLPMLDAHIIAAPGSGYCGTEAVMQGRLDELLPQRGVSAPARTFLKIDVQGYERSVLNGASELLASDLIAGMQLELSLAPLYEGGLGYREAFELLERLGMKLMGLDPVLSEPDSGRLLQADAVFFRAQ
jgi:FkbM family methyltransferase